jgi:heat shock protein HspQ
MLWLEPVGPEPADRRRWRRDGDFVTAGQGLDGEMATAKFPIGQIVRHRVFPFRGVIFDVDPVFSNTDEWYESIPEEIRPSKDQPFYHLFAENSDGYYIAYVSEQNLLVDETREPVGHPSIEEVFDGLKDGVYVMRNERAN